MSNNNNKEVIKINDPGWLKEVTIERCSHGEFFKFDGSSMICKLTIDGDGNSTRYHFELTGDQWDGDHGPMVFEFYGQWEMTFLEQVFKFLSTISHG